MSSSAASPVQPDSVQPESPEPDVTESDGGPFPVPPFARRCREAAGDAWAASFDHPFVRALADGSLDPERFRAYQMQDARYLEAFADACSLVSVRCPGPADKLWFVDAARLALVVEGELHAGYGERLGFGPADVAALELTPTNRAYRDHLVAQAQRASLVEAVATLAPCPWLYVDLGRRLVAGLGGVDDGHPYADWLRTYADPAFDEYMEGLLERLQRFADAASEAERERAVAAFVTSARYEWMFWDQAWADQRWPV